MSTTITFLGYNSILKTAYKKGKLPSVKYGLYGEELTPETCTLEHLKCHCQGGKSELKNFALASYYENNKRGAQPLKDCLPINKARQYLDQFTNVVVRVGNKIFNGNQYKKDVTKTLHSLDVEI